MEAVDQWVCKMGSSLQMWVWVSTWVGGRNNRPKSPWGRKDSSMLAWLKRDRRRRTLLLIPRCFQDLGDFIPDDTLVLGRDPGIWWPTPEQSALVYRNSEHAMSCCGANDMSQQDC